MLFRSIPDFGYTYSVRQNNGGGTVFGVKGNLRLYYDHLFGAAGLSLGYHYNFRRYNVNGQALDYNAIENSFLIGVTF